jgi:hypothetical protein
MTVMAAGHGGRMRRLLAGGMLLAAVLAGVPPVWAQPATAVDPEEPAPVRMGPLNLYPRFSIREIGVDSNVFHDETGPREDFTATISPGLEAVLRLGRLRLSYDSVIDAVYFQTYKDQQSLNRSGATRLDVDLFWLQPFFEAGIADTRERPNIEIDARARRTASHVGAGLALAVSPRTAVTLAARGSTERYGRDEFFDGQRLTDVLDVNREALQAGLRFELTPLTTLQVQGHVERARFPAAPNRDAEHYQVGPALQFGPDALIGGRATVMWSIFRPREAGLPEFVGVTSAIGAAATLPGDTRLEVIFDREPRYSFEERQPYYLHTGGRLTVTKRLVGRLDVQVSGGRHSMAYRTFEPDEQTRVDRVNLVGGGFGVRIGDRARLGVNVERTERRSAARPDRTFVRERLFGSLTYGF